MNSSIGQKGMLTAGKVIALTAVKLLEDTARLAAAQKEFQAKTMASTTARWREWKSCRSCKKGGCCMGSSPVNGR